MHVGLHNLFRDLFCMQLPVDSDVDHDKYVLSRAEAWGLG